MFSQLGLGYSQLGVVGGAPAAAATTWDLSTVTAVTLSGGNLVATNTGTTAQEQGVHVASSHNPSTGKYYFECTITTFTGGAGVAVGIATPASTYTNIKIAADSGFLNSVVGHTGTGTILSPSGNTGFSLGALTTGAVICIAVDLTNRRIWFRAGAAGFWNGNAGHNPTDGSGGSGGFIIPGGSYVPFAVFGSSGFGGGAGVAGNVITANFGATSFVGAVPSGYAAGWP